jgi:molybdopterin-guanine dinucleotide biosynthesis protein A
LARQYHKLRNLPEYITIPGASKSRPELEGAVLAGGKSRRMGQDKLFLRLGAGTVLDAVCSALKPLVDRMRLVGREPQPGLLPSQPDLLPGLGPLSGIHAALATADADRVLVVACDLPFVTTRFLRGLVEAMPPDADAVVPSPGGEPVAVCALYRVHCFAALESRLERRELTARDFAKSLNARFLDDQEISALDPSGRCLVNLNTPEDYERARTILRNESIT